MGGTNRILVEEMFFEMFVDFSLFWLISKDWYL